MSDIKLFESDLKEGGDPRNKGISYMFRTTVVSNLKMTSFSTIMYFVCTIIFFLQCIVDGVRYPGPFLQVKYGKLSQNLGFTMNKKKYQIWRSFTTLLLTSSFSDWFFNMVGVVVWGSIFERITGNVVWRIALVFFLSGISGNYFAAALYKNYGRLIMGASPGVFGYCGAFIGYIILNWKRMTSKKATLLIGILFILILNMGITLFNASVKPKISSHYSQIGGFIAGIFVGMVVGENSSRGLNFKQREKQFGALGYLIFTLICFVIFYLK